MEKKEIYWSRRQGLNLRPSDYKSDALPAELRRLGRQHSRVYPKVSPPRVSDRSGHKQTSAGCFQAMPFAILGLSIAREFSVLWHKFAKSAGAAPSSVAGSATRITLRSVAGISTFRAFAPSSMARVAAFAFARPVSAMVRSRRSRNPPVRLSHTNILFFLSFPLNGLHPFCAYTTRVPHHRRA